MHGSMNVKFHKSWVLNKLFQKKMGLVLLTIGFEARAGFEDFKMAFVKEKVALQSFKA